MYGACLPRFRRSDFEEVAHHDGISPAWPFGYDDLEPFYTKAEELFEVHGALGEDPTEPEHSTPYPYPPLSHEPAVERFAVRLGQQGLHPFHMANGMHLPSMVERRADATADGSPSPTGNKSDAENRAVRPALESPTVRLLLGAYVRRLLTNPAGDAVTVAEADVAGRTVSVEAKTFVVCGGAVNSAALLLRSVSDQHPNGLGNSSGLLGRNYMVHNSTFFLAVNPARRNDTAWQKTLGLNDWYEAGPDTPYPLGNLQMLGKLRAPMVKAARPWAPMWASRWSPTAASTSTHDRTCPGQTTGSSWRRQDHDQLDPEQPRATPADKRSAGRSARWLPDRAHRTHGHRHQLPHVRRLSPARPGPQRSRRLPQPRRDNLFIVDGSFFFLRPSQPGFDHRRKRAPRRADHRQRHRPVTKNH
jgi:choline dehydrogenase-like flavoprotein